MVILLHFNVKKQIGNLFQSISNKYVTIFLSNQLLTKVPEVESSTFLSLRCHVFDTSVFDGLTNPSLTSRFFALRTSVHLKNCTSVLQLRFFKKRPFLKLHTSSRKFQDEGCPLAIGDFRSKLCSRLFVNLFQ